MKRLSLAASLLIFGGLSMFASSAHADINVPFSTSQEGGCTLVAHGLLPIAVVPGELVVDATDTNNQTLTSSSTDGNAGSNGQIGLICTQSFTASAGNPVQVPSSGISQFGSGTASLSSGTGLAIGEIGFHILDVDMTATTTESVIAAGDYNFLVPVTIATN